MGREVTETTPLEDSAPQTSTPSSVAAGIPAILSTMKHGFSKVGVLSTVQTLSRVNRFGGFDCPGCAWPDPDNHRTIAEFCENGAKAVADEATSKKSPKHSGRPTVLVNYPLEVIAGSTIRAA